MTIIGNWQTFRWYATPKVVVFEGSTTHTFGNHTPDTITRSAGSYITDGVEAGMVVQPLNTAGNDQRRFSIQVVEATKLVLGNEDEVFPEASLGCTLTCYYLDNDGVEEFPGPFGHTNLVRFGGFDGGITGIPSLPTCKQNSYFDVTVNSYAADTTAGVDEYHWYLSQRTDDPTKQYVEIQPLLTGDVYALASTFSGTVRVWLTTLGQTHFDMWNGATPEVIRELFKHCHLYCIRVSDGAIQWVDMLQTMFEGV